MPEATQLSFSHGELAEILVRHQGIKKGHWGIFCKFGIGAQLIPVGDDSESVGLAPAAIVPVLELGIREFDKPNSITFDATQLSEDPKPIKKVAKRRK